MQRLSLSFILVTFLHVQPFYGACNANRASAQSAVRVVDHYMTDNILHRRWAVTMDCNHPERPWGMEEVQWQSSATPVVNPAIHLVEVISVPAPLVTTGTKVRVWRVGKNASLQLRGIALEPGELGQTIHVRMQQPATVLECKVSGTDSVELLAPDRWKSQ
jgi:hypothetical protein